MRTWLVPTLGLLLACDGKSTDTDTDPPDTEVDTEPVIDTESDPPTGDCTYLEFDEAMEPAFDAGRLWGDWILASSSTEACEPTGERCDDCWHGGELRVLRVETDCACEDLQIRDSESALRWSCSDPGGGSLEFTSGFFAAGKGLADLIDPTGPAWKPMSLILTAGELVGESDPDTWWTNPVEPVPEDGVLDGRSTVYVATEDGEQALTVTASGVSLLIPPGLTWTGPGGTGAVISAFDVERTWIEGEIDATLDRAAIELQDAPVTTVHRARIHGPTGAGDPQAGVRLVRATGSRITETAMTGGEGTGVSLIDSDGTCLWEFDLGPFQGTGVHVDTSDNAQLVAVVTHQVNGTNVHIDNSHDVELGALRQHDAGGFGLDVTASDDLHLSNARLFNGDDLAVHLDENCDRAVLLDVSSVGGGEDGLSIQGPDAVLSQITVASHEGIGLVLDGAGSVLAAALFAGNGDDGVRATADRATLVDIASAHNGGYGVVLTGDQTQVSGLLILGDNAQGSCSDAVVGSGLTAACAPEGSSDATVRTGASVASSLLGKLTIDEVVNTSDVLGAASYTSITDWSAFEHGLRGWSLDLTFPAPQTTNRCEAGNTCRVWDWSLRDTDTVLLNALTAPSGDDVVVHQWSANSDGACQLVDGTWDGATCTATFLRHAQETLADAFGNDNGLCESVDSCLYLPNIGAYQGHGPQVRGPTFVDGVVDQVTLRALRNNGRPALVP